MFTTDIICVILNGYIQSNGVYLNVSKAKRFWQIF